MTSRQARQTGEKAKQQRRKSSTDNYESKKSGHLKGGKSTSHQEQPEIPQQPLSQASQTSQYQNTSSTDLPLATTWPDPSTVPSHVEMNYALLGLTSSSPSDLSPTPPQQPYFASPKGQTTHQYPLQYQQYSNVDASPGQTGAGEALAESSILVSHMPSIGYNMTVMGRWSAEHSSQQGALLVWEKQQDKDLVGVTRWGLKRV